MVWDICIPYIALPPHSFLFFFVFQESCQEDTRLTLLKKTNIPGENLSIANLVSTGPGASRVCSETGPTLQPSVKRERAGLF